MSDDPKPPAVATVLSPEYLRGVTDLFTACQLEFARHPFTEQNQAALDRIAACVAKIQGPKGETKS